MKKPMLLLLPLSLLLATPAQANLGIYPMRAAVDAKQGAQIRVYSQSTQPQFVQATLRRIADPAGEAEAEVEVEPDEAAIAITPGKFALSGGGNRLIRVIPLQPVDKEEAYRIYFEGVRGPDESPMQDADDASRANVGVNLVWGALVNVVPTDGVVDLQLQGDTLHNSGSLRVGITGVTECTQAGVCADHEVSQSLYPDADLKLPFQPKPGSSLQLRYRLTGKGHHEHRQTLAATAS
ncbi:pilus assembly protein [Stenotrophomonas maltophilia]|uniref:pilus assembly protein n=1 Tax=Stenotrophomonas maltophilia TaxID=40324 RepID=UPI001313B211